MKKRMIVCLCVVLTSFMIGCNNSEDVHSNDANNSSTNVENNSNNQNQNSSLDENSDGTNQIQVSLETVESMLPVFEAIITTDMLTGLEYGVWNTDFMWTSCNMLVYAMASEGVLGEISSAQTTASSEEVKACINAMFSGFDGNKQDLPEVSGDLVTYNEAKDSYTFEVGDYGAQYVKVASYESAKDSDAVIVYVNLHYDGENAPAASYQFEVEKSSYTGTSAEVFPLMVVSFEEITKSSDTDLEEGMITEGEALALAEKTYGKDGQPDPDTGNIISYGLEGMEELNGKTYYNFRMSWLVIDEEGMASHSSYLCNVFVCADGSEILDVLRNIDGEWEVLED